MLDFRIYTFIKLCEVMNYRKTAEELNMTQPAVTQHIKYLENEYNCKLFSYNGRKLDKTKACIDLERYARSVIYNDLDFKSRFSYKEKKIVRIGATKTIGDYIIGDKILDILQRNDVEMSFTVDNTEQLLAKINDMSLDLALIEGFFDKDNFGYKLLRKEEIVGICAKNHKFAGKQVKIEDIFSENLVIREDGSGTRAVFEAMLKENNFSIDCFKSKAYISSVELIKNFVFNGYGISFVYDSVAKSDENLAVFKILDTNPWHEFNYVFLKNTSADVNIKLFE